MTRGQNAQTVSVPLAGVVLGLRMPSELVGIEVHFAQVARGVPLGLIVEVR